MDLEVKTYLAGIIDGEGCLMISSHKGRADRIIMTVSNSDPRLMKWLRDKVGGSVFKEIHRQRPTRKPCYVWRLHGSFAVTVIKDILPYLVVKREQADVVLAFDEFPKSVPRKGCSRTAKRLSTAELTIRNDFQSRLKELKRIHIPAETNRGDIFLVEDDVIVRTVGKLTEMPEMDIRQQELFN